jgi:hypothetical protein
VHTSRLAATLALLFFLSPACGGSSGGGGTTDAGPGGADAGPDSCPAARTCGDDCCDDGEECVGGACTTATACDDDDDCQDDSYCDTDLGQCVPYDDGETDDECTQISLVGVFAPDIQCEWVDPPPGDAFPGHINVLATPAVADFDFDGDPGTLEPSIVFPSYNNTDGGNDACVGNATYFGVIRVVSGRTCEQLYTISSTHVVASGPVAIADLDGAADGRPEIVAHRVGGGMVAFRYDETDDDFVEYWTTTSTLGAGACNWAGPSVHDVDDDGAPEVLMGASVFDGQSGAAIDETLGLQSVHSGQIPVVADLDGDGRPELATGDAIREWDPTAGGGVGAWVAVATGQGSAGLIAVADFGTYGANPGDDDRSTRDGIPEVAVVRSGAARIQTLAGRVIHGPITLLYFPPATNPGSGGPPTIADFDGDGRAELAVAGRGGYNVFDPDCVGTPDPATCNTLSTSGILWAAATQDISSSVTGSAVFDFEGDGSAEVVYGDECFSRVYDGASGEIVHSAFRTSCTWYENPIVADVDGDFNSEIVIPSNTNCPTITCPALDPMFDGLRCTDDSECPNTTTCAYEDPGDDYGRCRCSMDEDCGGSGYVCEDPIAGPSPAGQVCRAGHPGVKVHGIRVVRDALDRWVNSRPVWNQHAYSVTNVLDDADIPQTSSWTRNWSVPEFNNFRQAIAGDPDSDVSPDVTNHAGDYTCVDGRALLETRVCNRGTEPVGAGVPVTFYQGDPADGDVICTASTAAILAPGACESVSCTWDTPPSSGGEVTGVADDDGTGTGQNTECHEGNNLTFIDGVGCDQVE